ncbi:MAG: hypothetical protein WC501_00470 [Candidatus Micrarchaeia archaeon]|jgi:hypothetical protein
MKKILFIIAIAFLLTVQLTMFGCVINGQDNKGEYNESNMTNLVYPIAFSEINFSVTNESEGIWVAKLVAKPSDNLTNVNIYFSFGNEIELLDSTAQTSFQNLTLVTGTEYAFEYRIKPVMSGCPKIIANVYVPGFKSFSNGKYFIIENDNIELKNEVMSEETVKFCEYVKEQKEDFGLVIKEDISGVKYLTYKSVTWGTGLPVGNGEMGLYEDEIEAYVALENSNCTQYMLEQYFYTKKINWQFGFIGQNKVYVFNNSNKLIWISNGVLVALQSQFNQTIPENLINRYLERYPSQLLESAKSCEIIVTNKT